MDMTRRSLLGGAVGLAASGWMRGATAKMPLGANVILPGVAAVYTIAGQAGYRETDDPAVLCQRQIEMSASLPHRNVRF